jgi:hypothetical protein
MKGSFQESKARLLADPLAKRILASVCESELPKIACRIAEENPYKDFAFLRDALMLAGAASINICRVLEHHLWCVWREAQWATGQLTPDELDSVIDIQGAEWLEETRGKPTILVAPMTLCTSDTLNCITLLANRIFGSRPLIFYGENMDEFSIQLASADGLDALRQILRVLSAGGVFCTYADFVYRGHSSVPVRMFSRERPMSAGFVYLATRPSVHLLPCSLTRHEGRIKATLMQSFLLQSDANHDTGQSFFAQVAAQVVASTLEGLIQCAPEQWLLLPTLTFDSPEMAPSVKGESGQAK